MWLRLHPKSGGSGSATLIKRCIILRRIQKRPHSSATKCPLKIIFQKNMFFFKNISECQTFNVFLEIPVTFLSLFSYLHFDTELCWLFWNLLKIEHFFTPIKCYFFTIFKHTGTLKKGFGSGTHKTLKFSVDKFIQWLEIRISGNQFCVISIKRRIKGGTFGQVIDVDDKKQRA